MMSCLLIFVVLAAVGCVWFISPSDKEIERMVNEELREEFGDCGWEKY